MRRGVAWYPGTRAGLPKRNPAFPDTAALPPVAHRPLVQRRRRRLHCPQRAAHLGAHKRRAGCPCKKREDRTMFSHVMIGTNDLDKAKAFYDALLGTLEVRPAKVDRHRIFYFTKSGTFSVSKPINGEPATAA